MSLVYHIVGSLFVSLIILVVVNALLRPFPDRGRGQSLDYNRRVGRWRVKYPDGYYSQPFCRDVAEDYAETFHGTVVPITEYKSEREVNFERAQKQEPNPAGTHTTRLERTGDH